MSLQQGLVDSRERVWLIQGAVIDVFSPAPDSDSSSASSASSHSSSTSKPEKPDVKIATLEHDVISCAPLGDGRWGDGDGTDTNDHPWLLVAALRGSSGICFLNELGKAEGGLTIPLPCGTDGLRALDVRWMPSRRVFVLAVLARSAAGVDGQECHIYDLCLPLPTLEDHQEWTGWTLTPAGVVGGLGADARSVAVSPEGDTTTTTTNSNTNGDYTVYILDEARPGISGYTTTDGRGGWAREGVAGGVPSTQWGTWGHAGSSDDALRSPLSICCDAQVRETRRREETVSRTSAAVCVQGVCCCSVLECLLYNCALHEQTYVY